MNNIYKGNITIILENIVNSSKSVEEISCAKQLLSFINNCKSGLIVNDIEKGWKLNQITNRYKSLIYNNKTENADFFNYIFSFPVENRGSVEIVLS